MSTYSIRDLEYLTGVRAHTIRIWEQRYDIISPKRTDTNIRYYDSDDLKHMLNISLLNNHGYKISKIAKMSKEEVSRTVFETMNSQRGDSQEDQISSLTIAMVDLNEDRFEKVVSTSILHLGFEATMQQVIIPFLVRIGCLWQTGSISPAQEHFITNLIRQKLLVAIDGQCPDYSESHKRVLLYLPEGEMHELTLLFAYYLVRSRGHRGFYFGQNLPDDDLKSVVDLVNPDMILTALTSIPKIECVKKYINMLKETYTEIPVLLSGSQVLGLELDLPSNFQIIPNFDTFTEILENFHSNNS
ncbi:MerR family transcriptional regulator [Sediminitomix flava]|uniref:DNA-binding transcriptional MerR regulator n=1 Tax=Sediminitomix flava TaxID=379075 RepID=A0A315Z632_SEDFL|nr:MerR family transcriptional regulator [Sediminitomix flava]PWJ39114.1 DNA-binding transcriptional MerR regulator [Sediminitomix flava]